MESSMLYNVGNTIDVPTICDMTSRMQKLVEIAGRAGVIRPRDLDEHGIPRSYLARMEASGALERRARGLYVPVGVEATEHHDLAMACKRVPHGVVCLLSALRFHDLGTQAPFETWLAIDVKARAPLVRGMALRIVRMSGESREAGVEEREIEGVTVKVYSAAKTVADCFKFRNKVGIDVALEAAREYLRRGESMDDLWRFARVCRVAEVARPYLEAIA